MVELIHNAHQYLTQTLSPRFEIELIPYAETLDVIDTECRSQFDRYLKDYYISEINGRFLLIFRSRFDYFKDQIYLKAFEVEFENLAEKIVFLADFLKKVYS